MGFTLPTWDRRIWRECKRGALPEGSLSLGMIVQGGILFSFVCMVVMVWAVWSFHGFKITIDSLSKERRMSIGRVVKGSDSGSEALGSIPGLGFFVPAICLRIVAIDLDQPWHANLLHAGNSNLRIYLNFSVEVKYFSKMGWNASIY